MSTVIEMPILVFCTDYATYMRFVRMSELNQGETKQIKNLEDLRGFKDKLLMVIERGELPLDLRYYAKDHNIRMVYHNVI